MSGQSGWDGYDLVLNDQVVSRIDAQRAAQGLPPLTPAEVTEMFRPPGLGLPGHRYGAGVARRVPRRRGHVAGRLTPSRPAAVVRDAPSKGQRMDPVTYALCEAPMREAVALAELNIERAARGEAPMTQYDLDRQTLPTWLVVALLCGVIGFCLVLCVLALG